MKQLIKRDLSDEQESEYIVYGIIHNIERKHRLWCFIPEDVINLCFMFYYIPFVEITVQGSRGRYRTPLDILFALFKCEYAISKRCWKSYDKFDELIQKVKEQTQYLQMHKIATNSQRKEVTDYFLSKMFETSVSESDTWLQTQVMNMLTKYYQIVQVLPSKPFNMFSRNDLILVLVSQMIASAADADRFWGKAATHPYSWAFVAALRNYFHETKYDTTVFLSDYATQSRISGKFGLVYLKRICRKYELKSGPFSKCKRLLNRWALKLLQYHHIKSQKQAKQAKQISMNEKLFVKLVDPSKATPIILLLAMFNSQHVLLCDNYLTNHINDQCNQLQLSKVSISHHREQTVVRFLWRQNKRCYFALYSDVLETLSKYYCAIQSLASKPAADWTDHEIMLSYISYLVEACCKHMTKSNNIDANYAKLWEYVEYLRRYCNDKKYDGKLLLNPFSAKNQISNESVKGFGLSMMQSVCNAYQLQLETFSKVKNQLTEWTLNRYTSN